MKVSSDCKTEQETTTTTKSDFFYLGSDLVSALTGLQMHNFAHFGQMDGKIFGQETASGAAEIRRVPADEGLGILRICGTASDRLLD